MRGVTAGVASALLSVSAFGQAGELAPLPELADPIVSRLPSPAPLAEAERISQAIADARERWRFLDGEQLERLRKVLESVKVDGFTTQPAEQLQLSHYRLITIVDFKPCAGQPALTLGEMSARQAMILSQISGLAELREAGYLSYNQIEVQLTKEGTPRIGMLSFGGPRAEFHSEPGIFAHNLEDPQTRAAWWTQLQSTIDLQTRLGFPPSPKDRAEVLNILEGLRGYYTGSGDEFMARLTQALHVYFAPNAATIRTYVNMGRLGAEEREEIPESLGPAIAEVTSLTRNVLAPKDIEALIERTKGIECPNIPLCMLALEKRAQIYPDQIVDLAYLEILDAIRFAKVEFQNSPEKSPDAAASIVRRYFDEYFLNDYVFSDHTPGFAGGISLRRTDCSIRAILAYEMLSALGFQCGTETILAYKDGKPIPGVLGHIYNFIDAPGKGRLFFDFSRSSDETFRFESAEPIVTTYRAGDARIEVRTTLSSSDPGDVYGQLVAEPVIDDARNFCAAFQKHGGTLAAFLFDNPDQIAVMQRLRWFSEQVDQIFKKNQTTAWIEGTQDSIRSIYPALFP